MFVHCPPCSPLTCSVRKAELSSFGGNFQMLRAALADAQAPNKQAVLRMTGEAISGAIRGNVCSSARCGLFQRNAVCLRVFLFTTLTKENCSRSNDSTFCCHAKDGILFLACIFAVCDLRLYLTDSNIHAERLLYWKGHGPTYGLKALHELM